MGKHAITISFWITYGTCLLSSSVGAASPGLAPRFDGESLPQPPQQGALWAPPATELPAAFVSATKVLFDQGLADPRGTEYREIEVGVGEPWGGDGGVVKTHGWILPRKAADDHLFAVCWNGLVYPVVSSGEKADVRTDGLAVAKTEEERLGRGARAFSRTERATQEKWSIAYDSFSLLKACLLLRLGEPELAARLWRAGGGDLEETWRPDQPKDPYLVLAREWTWALFDRSLCAHMRGDDKLALLGARTLARLQPIIDLEAEKRGFERQPYLDNEHRNLKRPYLEFLEPLPGLLADQERRARRGEHPSVLQAGLDKIPDQGKRIAALIDNLDEVCARQMGQPGRVAPEWDPIAAALVKEGEAAVEPLLACMETDKRLTRSVGFHRDFFRHRVIVSVRGAARAALENILHKEFPSDVAEIRTYWNQFRGTSLEDRWYRALQDETGEALQAAQSIIQPDNVVGVPGGFLSATLPLEAGQKPKFRGEILRGKKNPSVTELMLKQAVVATGEAVRQDQAMGVDALDLACKFTLILSEWEKPAAVSSARALMRRAIELFADERSFTMSSGHDLARALAQLTEARVKGGDPGSLAEYVTWLKSASPKKIGSYVLEVFEPLWCNPDDPAVMSAAQWLFNDEASPWSVSVTSNKTEAGYRAPELIVSPLVALRGFQEHLLRSLADTKVIGTVKTLGEGRLDVKVHTGGGGTQGGPFYDDSEAATGIEVPFRTCDYYAWKLSQLEGTPHFQLFWQEARRDEVVQKLAAFLKRYGERYKFDPSFPTPERR